MTAFESLEKARNKARKMTGDKSRGEPKQAVDQPVKTPGAILETVALTVKYGDSPAVKEVTLKIPENHITAIIGPSGCGKSTLVNLVAGFETPDSGTISVDGKPVTGPGHDRMVVFQETALMPWLTTYQNVVFGPKLRGDLKGEALVTEAERLLEKVGLTEFRDKYPLQLSGGMQRRAELARALINQPLLMIMDEPFRGLDAMTRELMQEFFLRLFEEYRRTNLFVTSEIEEAIFLADEVYVMTPRPGRIAKVIDVPLERPRELTIQTSPEFNRLVDEARDVLGAH